MKFLASLFRPGDDDSLRYALEQIELDLKNIGPGGSSGGLLIQSAAPLPAGSGNGTKAFGHAGLSVFGSGTTNALHMMYLDPADWGSAPLTLRGTCVVNATAPGSGRTFTNGLYPVTAVAGGSGGVSYTAGTVVAGSTFAINGAANLAASTRYEGDSGSFSFPSAGWYVPGQVQAGGTTASGCVMAFTVQLVMG